MAWTFTIRRPVTPAEWRQLWQCWRNKANRQGAAAVYRVELQKRKVPHVHMTAWMPNRGEEFWQQQELFTDGWLDTITPKQPDGTRVYDAAELYRAVKGRLVEDHSAWAIYESLHSSKKGQSGWVGKQWGIIGRRYFKRRESVQLELTLPQYWAFRRIVSRWLKSKGSRHYGLPAHGKWLRCIPSDVSKRIVDFVSQPVAAVERQ
jgi:hypothetical protein